MLHPSIAHLPKVSDAGHAGAAQFNRIMKRLVQEADELALDTKTTSELAGVCGKDSRRGRRQAGPHPEGHSTVSTPHGDGGVAADPRALHPCWTDDT